MEQFLIKKYNFKNNDSLILNQVTDFVEPYGTVKYLKLYYASSDIDYKTNELKHFECGVQYFHIKDKELALIDFSHRTKNEPREYSFELEDILARLI